MPISEINSARAVANSEQLAVQQAFRQADFLKIMLAEITNQDPLQPTETSKMVENMKALQELANTTYRRFRDDLRWAQELVGKTVTVAQAPLTAAERAQLVNKGLNPDVGYATVDGRIEGFRVVDERVWLTIGGKHYAIDRVQQIQPPQQGADEWARLAPLIGLQARYALDQGTREGIVGGIAVEQGRTVLSIGSDRVPLERVLALQRP
ncbi:MAG: flagellar hook capping FlgD N-terminal domain-containing protein [Planctomycetota bacterium]|nr:hypothetical protein [Planctomycetota bacterium]MDW8373667.1 flagellar hook capping FlgD N-terminal domain-containing protein [Planctomycetota bacterium]